MVKYQIKDTALEQVGGDSTFTPVDTDWHEFSGTTFRVQGEVLGTNYSGTLTDTTTGHFDYQKNINTSITTPRINVTMVFDMNETADVTELTYLMAIVRSKGIKQFKGGLKYVLVSPDTVGSEFLYVRIANWTVTEIIANSTNIINVTLAMEQVGGV